MIHLIYQIQRFQPQLLHDRPGELETTSLLHIPDRILLDLQVLCLLLENAGYDHIGWICADRVDYGERELAFGEIFSYMVSLVGVVACR